MNKHVKARPQQVTPLTNVQCYGCGWKGILAQSKQSIYIDSRWPVSASNGGNGKNYRCPLCKQLIFYTRYDNRRQIIAPQGHQYRNAV
jgi:hypothetical protein